MRLTRPRFTIRRLMVAVVVVAIAMFVGQWVDEHIGTYCIGHGVGSRHFLPAIGWMARAVTLGYLVAAWIVTEIGKKKRLRSLESKSESTHWF
jgi:hypothetical protein